MEMKRPESTTNVEWIRYKRFAQHNLPKHIREYLEYKSKLSGGRLNKGYFTRIALELSKKN